MPPRRRSAPRRLALACATALPLLAPAAASAATVEPTQRCVLDGRRSLGLSSTGWAPGASLQFRLGGTLVGTGTADALGSFSTGATPLRTPRLGRGRHIRRMGLTATDGTTVAGPVRIKVVHRSVEVPDTARPWRRVTYRAYGFPHGERLYLHVRRGGRTRARVLLGRPWGVCGVLRKRLRYLPVARYRVGRYELWFSNRRNFRARSALYGYAIVISRRPR